MDLAAFHILDSILVTLHENNIIPSIIPSGCTRLLQSLDTAVNKLFKEYLREETETYQDEHATNENIGKIMTTFGLPRNTTHVVSHAWKAFSFQDVGVMLLIDGSQDGDIKIKGFTTSEIDIGNWAEDLTILQSSLASQSYCTLPTETPEHHSLHYVW
ncbi:hypothetical protein L873DRAFT_1804628 [Choiromyces venosus 120613-1]|uniref:Uncharacterized protein n=1 Tax=Choiromyces venosus 120613-1 TaxID=1336337 RepID=A0A3N4JXK9_9PEZI|nr:hypothetical protein L873DRAFT_1804628 [Choiromyces venosus 120613-1]